MKKSLKVMSAAGLSAAFVASTIVPAEASVISRVLQDDNGTVFQYNQQELEASFVAHKLNPNSDGAKLFKHYMDVIKSNPQGFVAFEDDKNGYVSYASIASAFSASKLSGETFNVNEFTESGEGTPENVTAGKKVSVDENGLIVETDFTPVDPPVDLAVESAIAIDATTIEVTFNDGTVVEFELEEALVEGENEVILTYEEVEYTVTVTYQPEIVGELVVENVSAINKTTVELTFNQELPEDFDTSLVDVKNLNVQKVTISGNKVLVTVSGAEFEKEYDVTYGDTTQKVKFGTVDQYYTLQLVVEGQENEELPVVEASGTTVLLTAKIIDNATGEIIDDAIDGAVQFLTTAGALGQQQIVIQNGKASVQLKSVSSLETVYADITAKVVGGSEVTGLVGNTVIKFAPKEEQGNASIAVPVVKAQTESADRVTVVLGQPKPGLTADQLDAIARAARVTDSVTTSRVNVKEARQIKDNIVELVLDTYNTTQANYLTDNAVHTVQFSAVQNLIEASALLSFKLTDSTKQFALGATGLNQRTIEVRFDNPVAITDNLDSETVEKYSALNKSNYVLDGKPLSPDTKIDVKPGTDGKVVLIKLAKEDTIKEENTILQVRNVGDWAGITDSANLITTQDLFLTTAIVDTTPVVTVEENSPEQYLLKLSQPVTTDAALSTLIETRYGAVLDADQDSPLTGKKGDLTEVLDATSVSPNVVYTALDENGVKVDPTTTEFTSILVELTDDWTNILAGKAHWVASPQVQFKIAKNVFKTDLDNKNAEVNTFASNARDSQSPIISNYTQVNDDGDYTNGALVEFNEPVQLPDGLQGSGANTTPNASQKAANNDVQAPVVEFSIGNVVVEGALLLGVPGDFSHTLTTAAGTTVDTIVLTGDAFTDLTDVAEANDIEVDANGNYVWTVTVTGVSDDYGNTMATQEFEFVVPADPTTTPVPTTALEINPFVVYANYQGSTTADVITIKFSEVMANKDATGVGLVSNYILNSQQLSSAAGAQITRGIEGVTEAWDGVTITLPAGSVESENFMLTLPTNFTSADGQKLTLENVLNFVETATDEATFTQKHPVTENNGVLFTNTYDENATEVLNIAHTIVGATATATAASITDGYLTDLDVVITFSDAAAATAAATLQVTVNGKVIPTGAATVTNSNELTIDLDSTTSLKAEDLELADGDVIEVKINGQTMFVQAVEAQ